MGRAGVELTSSAVLAVAVLSPGHVCVQWERLGIRPSTEVHTGRRNCREAAPGRTRRVRPQREPGNTDDSVYGEKETLRRHTCLHPAMPGAEGNHGGAMSWALYSVAAPTQVTESALHHCHCYHP